MAKKLTAIAVENAQPGERRQEIPDGLLSGLYFIVQPSGAKSWAVRYRHRGKPRKLTLGPYPALELKHAREMAGEALRAAAQGRDPAAEKRRRRTAPDDAARNAVPAVIDQFLERYAKLKSRSYTEVRRILKKDAEPFWRDRT